MKLKGASFVALAIVAIGCAHTHSENTRNIKVNTDPPGMRIFFGMAGTEESARQQREFIGLSPCKVTVPSDREGRFQNNVSSFARPKAVLMAEPPAGATNLFPRSQVFSVPAMFVRPPPIPSSVFFDMTQPQQ